ncbi:delta-9 fatty acid desaturas-like protein [Penicillium herquei]|nr:delta-9 fatty acid desaturas-like protein [Penicillium herquei]
MKVNFQEIWGQWWHNLFRFTFLGIADWVIRSSKVDERLEEILILSIPFVFYSAIHASLSYSVCHDALASVLVVVFGAIQPFVILTQLKLRQSVHSRKKILHDLVGLTFLLTTFGLLLGNPGVLHSLASFPIPISVWRKGVTDVENEAPTATVVLAFSYALLHGLCITIGYHRLWAHKSFRAHVVLRIILAVIGAGAVQRSIKWWDDIMQEWDVDISDLESDPVVEWQDRYYIPLSLFMSFVVPGAIAWLGWGDLYGGLFWAGSVRINVAWHLTFLVNSLAHWAGTKPFSSRTTARDNPFVGIFTLGESYHNFHHEFPTDYRNGVDWFAIDLSKWIIWSLAAVGLATHLNRVSDKVIASCRQGKLQKSQVVNNDPGDGIPAIEWEEYVRQAESGRALVAIAGFVYDVTDFQNRHPGGKTLAMGVGKDATAMFYGGVFQHSVAASDILSTMQVYVIRGGGAVEIRRKS